MTDYYSAAYQAMIKDWRLKKTMGDFAVITMQLPPSEPHGSNVTDESGRPAIRLAQQQAQARIGGTTLITGAAVGLDLGGISAWGIDHPPNKNEMAKRLAAQVLHVAYARQVPLWTGPVFSGDADNSVKGLVTVKFDLITAGGGMTLRDVKAKNIDGTSNDCIACCNGSGIPFEVALPAAGSENEVTWVRIAKEDVEIVSGVNNTIKLKFSSQEHAVSIRYAYSDYVECVLDNIDTGFPAGPFVYDFSSSFSSSDSQQKAVSHGFDMLLNGGSPPMGYNTWNFAHCNIDEIIVKELVTTFHSTGLAAAGYEYVNIDDCWQVDRFPNGKKHPNIPLNY